MKVITLCIDESYLKALNELVTQNYYPNRAEAIRMAIRDMLRAELWERLPDEAKVSEGGIRYG